jgi:hypothetical protein
LSFAVLRDRRFLPALESGQQIYDELWRVTADTVVAMRGLLENGLRLDAIRFLPDTTSLLPLFLWLIRYPDVMRIGRHERAELRPEFQSGAARLALLLLLRDPTKQQMMRWAAVVATSQSDAAGVLEQVQREVTVTGDFLNKKLQDANSLTNRYTLLLYALQRSQNARDFHYEKNRLIGKQFAGTNERWLADECEPQKQHIVPYSHLIDIYDLESRSRISSTEANNIGNITYISKDENSLEGLADRLVELAYEDSTNLSAHFISEGILSAYEKVKELVESGNAALPSELKAAYETWICRRRHDIVQGFLRWIEKLDDEWTRAAQHVVRVEPVRARLARPALPYLVRGLQLPDRIEDALIELFESDTWRLQVKAGEPSEMGGTLVLCLERNRRKAVRDVQLSSRRLFLPVAGDRPARTIEWTDSDLALEELRQLPAELQVRLEQAAGKKGKEKKHGSSSPRVKITREALLFEVAKAGQAAVRIAERLLSFSKKLGGYEQFGNAAVSIRVKNSATGKPCTLYVVTRKGTFYIRSLGRWQANAGVGPDFGLAYDRELTQILGRSPRQMSGDKKGARAIPLADLAPQLDAVLAVVASRAETLRGVDPAVVA